MAEEPPKAQQPDPSGWSPLAFNLVNGAGVFPDRDITGLRWNLVSGKNRSVRGVDMGFCYNFARKDSVVAQLGGLGNAVDGNCAGVQLAAIAGNRAGRMDKRWMDKGSRMTGIQLGALANFGNVRGLQVAYQNGVNVITVEAAKKQPDPQAYQPYRDQASAALAKAILLLWGASMVPVTDGHDGANCPGTLDGVQLSALNQATLVDGAQLGFFGNSAFGLRGVQTSALVNRALRGKGAQLSCINRSRFMDGVQLGMVNVATELSGVQFGLLNFNEQGFLPFFPLINFNFWTKKKPDSV
jgi:hypothetical protein